MYFCLMKLFYQTNTCFTIEIGCYTYLYSRSYIIEGKGCLSRKPIKLANCSDQGILGVNELGDYPIKVTIGLHYRNKFFKVNKKYCQNNKSVSISVFSDGGGVPFLRLTCPCFWVLKFKNKFNNDHSYMDKR